MTSNRPLAGMRPLVISLIVATLSFLHAAEPVIDALHIADQAAVAAQDSTRKSYTQTVNLPAGRIAVGVVAHVTDHGRSVTISVGGTSEPLVLNKANLANLGSSYFEDGTVFDVGVAGNTQVTVTAGSGMEIHGVVVRRPDPVSGIVEDNDFAVHCSPLAAMYNGKRYQIHGEIYTGRRHVSIDGVPAGEVFGGIRDDHNEHYHDGGAVLALPDGVLFAQVGHGQPYVYLRYAPNGDLGQLSPERRLGGSLSSLTYIHMLALNDGSVLILTRGDTSGSAQNAIMWRLTNPTQLGTQNASATLDVILRANGGRWYPRAFHRMTDGANEVVGVMWNWRTGADWRTMHAALFAPHVGPVGRWYALDGDRASVRDSLGTESSPRFSSALAQEYTHSSNGIRLIGSNGAGNQRYIPATALFRVTQWPDAGTPARADFAALYADKGGSSTIYGPSKATYFVVKDGNRYSSASDFDFPDPIETSNSYRYSASLRWEDDRESTNRAVLVVTERGTHQTTNRYGEETDLYYDWGSPTKLSVYTIEAPLTMNPVFALSDTIPVESTYSSAFITPVQNAPNTILYQRADNELHPTHRQGQRVFYTWSGGSGSDPVASATAAPTLGNAPLIVQFDGTASTDADGPITGYLWQFGDGTPNASGAQVTHMYTVAGSYQATLQVTDADGNTDTTALTITVASNNQPPFIDSSATAVPNPANTGTPVNLSVTASDQDGWIASYAWRFGDGNNGSGSSPTHVYANPGIYTAEVTVTDNEGATTVDTVDVQVTSATGPIEVVVDNKDSGFSTTGSWTESNAVDEYNNSSLWTKTLGASATWTPELTAAGTYRVYAWWSAVKIGGVHDRDSSAEYQIHHSEGVDQVIANQDLQPGQWNLLGTFAFHAGRAGYVALVRDEGDSPESTSADAIRFTPVSETEIIVDNKDPGFSTTGSWTESNAIDEYANSSLWTKTANATATWIPSLPVAGTYQVYAWWSRTKSGGAHDRDSAADYIIHHGEGVDHVMMDQDFSPGRWNLLGTYAFDAGSAGYVELLRDVGETPESTSADAIKFVIATTTPEVIVDNKDPNFTTTGSWTESSAIDEHLQSSLWSTTTGATATWTPNLPEEGVYEVYAWWSATKTGGAHDRDSAAEYRIHHGGIDDTVVVDQDLNPGQWNRLGAYNFGAGSGGYVRLTRTISDTAQSTSADALRFVKVP